MADDKQSIIRFYDRDKHSAGITLNTETGELHLSKNAFVPISHITGRLYGNNMKDNLYGKRKMYPIKTITVEEGNERYTVKNGCLIYLLENSVSLCSDSMDKIPDDVTSLDYGCMKYAKFDNPNIVIPKSVTTYSKDIMSYSNVESVSITGDAEIYSTTFDCSSIKHIKFGNGNIVLHQGAFYTTKIEEIYLPSNLYLEFGALAQMDYLKKVICACELPSYAFKDCGTKNEKGLDIIFEKDVEIHPNTFFETKINNIICPYSMYNNIDFLSKIKENVNFNKLIITCGTVDKLGKLNNDVSKIEESYNEPLNENFITDFFKGCDTFQEEKEKVIDLGKRGLIGASLISMLITAITPNKALQNEIKQEIIEMSDNAENTSQNQNIEVVPKFDENVKFARDWKISEEGIAHIEQYEKFSSKPYYVTKKDKEKGIKTIGYGHVIKSSDPEWLKTTDSISESQAAAIFEDDIDSFGKLFKYEIAPTLNKGLQKPSVFPQVMMDAMLSMMYNSGNGNFKKESINPFYSRLKRCRLDKESGVIDKRDYDYTIASIPNSLIYHKGEVMKGLQNRRKTEYNMAAQAK